MADAFDAHRDELANFEDDLVDLCYDIIDAGYDTGNAYNATLPDVLTGKYAAPADYLRKVQEVNPTPTPSDFDTDEFNHAAFRDDIADLAQVELPIFLDGADPSRFDDVVGQLTEAAAHLQEAGGYTGLEELVTLIKDWSGEAAYNFERSTIPNFGVAAVHQAEYIEDLVAVALCMKEVLLRTRADALGLAEELHKWIDPNADSKFDLGSLLWVAAAIAGGIAAFGAVGATFAATVATRVSYVATTSSSVAGAASTDSATSAVGNVQQLSGGPTGDRTIEGPTAYEFIPSCLDQIQNVIKEGTAEVEAVMAALKADLSGDGPDLMCVNKPKIIDARESIAGEPENDLFTLVSADSGDHGFVVESISDLRYAGVVTLPTMAYFYDRAHEAVADLGAAFDAGIGTSVVLSGLKGRLAPAIEALTTAFRDTRDHLYDAGVALRDIADAYFDADADHEEMMNRFNEQLTEYEEGDAVLPKYTP